MPEISENSSENKYRLEIEFRNPLHAFLMREMLGGKTRDHQAQEEWATEYGKRISDIIDASAHEDIRTFARNGEYKKAAAMVREELKMEDEIRGL